MEMSIPKQDEEYEMHTKDTNKSWYASKSFWRQLFVCSGAWTMYFMTGMLVGAPTIFVPQMRREVNSTFVVDDETVSWLYSVYGLGALPWVFIVPIITRFFGRRLPFIIASINLLVVYIMLYFSTTTKQIILAEILQGFFQACGLSLCIVIISEYTSPKYRGIFLTLKSASFCWGFWVVNAIGTFFPWKYITVIGMIISCHTLTSFFWPDSPQWLASRGRFKDCEVAFRWLNEYNEDSERELKKLIENQTEYLKERVQKRRTCNLIEYNSIEFFKPLFLITVLIIHYFFTGKFVNNIYVLDIIRTIANSEKTAYNGMLILDGFTIVGVYCGCGLIKIFNRRKMYLVSSLIGIVFLFIISLYLYLVKFMLISENKILSVVLLTCLAVVINSGPMALTTVFFGELIPMKYKSTLMLVVASEYMLFSTVVLKTAPQVFRDFGLHGTFLMYAIVTTVCTYLLYLYLPETKDKTLQEIEEYFKKTNSKTTADSKEENESFVPL